MVPHELGTRADGAEWIVGRRDTRVFVSLPADGVLALRLLERGETVAATQARLLEATGDELDVAAFVRDLAALGFIAAVDGERLPSPPARPATFPRLRARHVRFLLHPALPWLPAALVLAALAVLATRPELMPSHHDLLWSSYGVLVVASGLLVGWSIVLLHEVAHLAVARAAHVPGRVGFGTRLQFLVMQTDISGIELAPRRHRLTAYLAGIGVNLTVASVAFLLLASTAPGTTVHRLLAALVLWAALPITFQLMVFMRTDLYFVLQDLTGCRDLYGDGRAYARYLARRVARRANAAEDPSRRLPSAEQRAVRIYSAFLVAGTVLCLAGFAAFTVPAEVRLIARAWSQLGGPASPLEAADAALTLAAFVTIHTIWFVTWRRQRRARRASVKGRSSAHA
ncbi:hypothetical protein H3146_11895 [Streptomyces sp. OF3]|uniref:PqqD family peptide modification chaperone n=1 Tax=Streptomyces alkaliterrae TaxID=2213162 RepID=A0A5P0YRU1_9ACTN|nr:hypothetical protein [Streptomyces alkaliterrae]MBB1260706.1 hypothetical protein [Streptomyces alkaliterrae]MQS02162.1 hypothetical protein [Streptomyces alkaliterrae]